MTAIGDSRRADGAGPGILPLQHHQPESKGEQATATPTEAARKFSLVDRGSVLAVRVKDRDVTPTGKTPPLGHWLLEKGTVGDLINSYMWSARKRGIPGWSFAWPVMSSVTSTPGVITPPPRPGTTTPDPDTPGGGGTTTPDPSKNTSRTVTPNTPGRHGYDPETGQWGGYSLKQMIAAAQAAIESAYNTRGRSGSLSKKGVQPPGRNLDNSTEWYEGCQYEDPHTSSLLPIRYSSGGVDNRFDPLAPYIPENWPSFPQGTSGILLAGTEENSQQPVYFPVDPRLVSAHYGKPEFGSIVADLNQDILDPNRSARLQTLCRVIKEPKGKLGVLQGNKDCNWLAWNIGQTRQGDGHGGLIADISPHAKSPGKAITIGMASARYGGPFSTGAEGDIHNIGKDADGNPINKLHFTTNALFIRDTVGAKINEDGPLLFEYEWQDGSDFDIITDVHCAFNNRSGYWGWWTTSCVKVTIITRVPDPGGGGPPDPPRGPTTPDPGGPGGDNGPPGGGGGESGGGGGEPDGPSPGGGGEPTPGPTSGGGPGTGGGDYTPDPEPPAPVPEDPAWFERERRRKAELASLSGEWARTYPTTLAERDAFSAGNPGGGRAHNTSFREMSFPSLSFRPQKMDPGAPDIRFNFPTPKNLQDKVETSVPTVIRADAFGSQNGCNWDYENAPNESIYSGGVGAGTLMFFSPNDDAYRAEQGKVIDTGAERYLATGRGVAFGSGVPNTQTGGIKDGWSWGSDPGGPLVFKSHDGDGNTQPTDIMELESGLDRINWEGTWDAAHDPLPPVGVSISSYTPGTYFKNQQVYDEGWTVIANKTTTDRAAPQQDGDEQYDLDPTPVWNYNNYNGVVESGREWATSEPITVIGYQVWVPVLTPDTNYVIKVYSYPVGKPEEIITEQVAEPILAADQWSTVAVKRTIVLANTVIGVIIDALNSGSSTPITGGWARAANNNDVTLDPGVSNWGTANSPTHVRINYTDLDTVDRTTELQGVTPGSTITIVDTLDASRSMTWSVAADGVDYGTHITFENVTYDGQGAGGEPPVGATCTINIDVPVPSPTQFVQAPGANPVVSWGTATGKLKLGGIEQVVPNDAFGVRVLADTWTVSPDWDLVAASSLGIGGGAGGAGIEGLPTPPPVGDLSQVTNYPDPGNLMWTSIATPMLTDLVFNKTYLVRIEMYGDVEFSPGTRTAEIGIGDPLDIFAGPVGISKTGVSPDRVPVSASFLTTVRNSQTFMTDIMVRRVGGLGADSWNIGWNITALPL